MSNILGKIKDKKSVAIFIHINPDPDAVGTATALARLVEKFGGVPYLYSENDISPKLYSFDGEYLFNSAYPDSFDLGVIVDANEITRIGIRSTEILYKCTEKFIIDHHIKGNLADIDDHYIDESASSASEVLYYLIKDYDLSLMDKKIAQDLYAGVLTDTGSFLFSSVTEKTMRMVADLYSYDIEAEPIARHLMRSVEKNVFDLKTEVLSNARFYRNNEVGIIVFTKALFNKMHASERDTENIVNEIVNINSVKIAVSMAEISDRAYKVSIRSKECCYAYHLARCFGGGGHDNASGCRIYGYFEDCLHRLVSAADDILSND